MAGISNGMLPVKYFRSNKADFLPDKFHGDHKNCHKVEANLAKMGILPDLKHWCLSISQNMLLGASKDVLLLTNFCSNKSYLIEVNLYGFNKTANVLS